MLTADLVRPFLRQEGKRLWVAWVDTQDPALQQTAALLIQLLHESGGQTVANWQQKFTAFEGDRVDYPFLRGLSKILADAATFTQLTTPLEPFALRKLLFAQGPVYKTPDIFHTQLRSDILEKIAEAEGIAVDEIDLGLYASRRDEFLLTHVGPNWSPEQLLARFNLELTRGALYSAIRVNAMVEGGYKDLFKFIKLFKLMYYARQRQEGGYYLDLAGPLSPFVSTTTRYGRSFAAWLPALFLADRWQMRAQIRSPLNNDLVFYELDSGTCPLQTSFQGSGPFDSRLEADFAAEFEEKYGENRGEWQLAREDQIIILGDTIMVPDFTFIHQRDEKRRIFVELIGYWTENYLKRKVQKLKEAQCLNMLLLVYEGVNLTSEKLRDIPGEVLYFPRKPVLKSVMETVERLAEDIYGPLASKPRKKRTIQMVSE
jgi:predicted nuclease of restriction endonuclease-like RecB superfamily